MGNRGKVREQQQARQLRAQGKTLTEIAAALGVSKSSVSLWVRDVPFTPSKRRYGPQARYHPWQTRKLREIEEMNQWGADGIGRLTEKAFLAAGAALYAGEGSKTDHSVRFANTDVAMVQFFCAWLRQFFEIDESRLRVRVYLHQGSTSTLPNGSGPKPRAFPARSLGSPIARPRIQPFARPSIDMAACT